MTTANAEPGEYTLHAVDARSFANQLSRSRLGRRASSMNASLRLAYVLAFAVAMIAVGNSTTASKTLASMLWT